MNADMSNISPQSEKGYIFVSDCDIFPSKAKKDL